MEIRKILGQAIPAADTGTYMYTVPDEYGAVISTIVVCNTDSSAATFSIHIVNAADGAAAAKNANFDTVALAGNDSVTITLGITLSNLDQVYFINNTGFLSISVYGVEFNQTNVYVP